MKLTLLSENLQKALSLVGHALSSRNQLPILSQTLIETRNGELFFQTTDLEIGIETKIAANITEEGAVAVPAKVLSELVNTLPQEKISLESTEGKLQIIGKKTKASIQTAPKEEFPELYQELGEKTLSFPKKTFKEMLEKVVFSASIESTRPALTGLLIKKTEEGTIFVATDGYRLSLQVVQKEKNFGDMKQPLILPARILREAFSLNQEEEIELFVLPKNNQAIFLQENTKIIGRLIEGEFPNYEKILPTDMSTKFTADREELLKAVKTCAIFARESANIITFSFQKEKVIVSGRSNSLGEDIVEVEGRLTGEENEIAFNGRYLLDVLGTLTDSEISFEMTGPLNPGVFKIPANPQFLHLIMPIRVQG